MSTNIMCLQQEASAGGAGAPGVKMQGFGCCTDYATGAGCELQARMCIPRFNRLCDSQHAPCVHALLLLLLLLLLLP
jgi:hypothetical protein